MEIKLSRQEYSDLVASAPMNAVVGSGYNVIDSPYISGQYIKIRDPIVNLNKCGEIFAFKEEPLSDELHAEGSTLWII